MSSWFFGMQYNVFEYISSPKVVVEGTFGVIVVG